MGGGGEGYGCVNQYFIVEDDSITGLCLIYARRSGWAFLLWWPGEAPRSVAEEPSIRPGEGGGVRERERETGDRACPGLPGPPFTAHLL